MEWLVANALALLALTVSVAVAIGGLIGFFLRTPRAFWVIESLDVEVWGTTKDDNTSGVGTFTFRNAGNGVAYLTTVELDVGTGGFFALNGLIKRTVKPDETISFQVSDTILDVARPQVVRFMSGEDFILDTSAVMRVTWSHRPSRVTLKNRRTFALRDEQNFVMPTRHHRGPLS